MKICVPPEITVIFLYLFLVIPVIEEILVPANVTAGDSTILTCISTGYPAPAISWLINDTLVVLDDNNGKMNIISNTIEEGDGVYHVNSSLLITGLVINDTNVYSCVATNTLASLQTVTSDQLQLNVLCK